MGRLTRGDPKTRAEFLAKRALGSREPLKVVSALLQKLDNLFTSGWDTLELLEKEAAGADSEEFEKAVPLVDVLQEAKLIFQNIVDHLLNATLSEALRDRTLYHHVI